MSVAVDVLLLFQNIFVFVLFVRMRYSYSGNTCIFIVELIKNNREMSKVLGFMKQVARGLQVEETLELLMSIAAVSMPLLLIVGKMILPSMR